MRETPFYLAQRPVDANSAKGDGRLTLAHPAREAVDTFTLRSGESGSGARRVDLLHRQSQGSPGSFDHTDIEQRPDVLVYIDRRCWREGLELTGPMTAVIAFSSDALDTDVTVKLLDVFPDGRAMNIVRKASRARAIATASTGRR